MTSPDTSSPQEASLRFACSVYISANYHFEPHSHVYNELVLVQQGRIRAKVADAEYTVAPGDLIIYPAGVAHEEWAEDGRPVLTWACAFLWDMADVFFCHDADGQIQEWIAWLAQECSERLRTLGGGRSYGLARLDRTFALPILNAVLAELKRLRRHDPNNMVAQVRAFVRENLKRSITLQELVDVAGLSKSRFIQQYHELTGRTPMEDARLLRVEEARHLIITSPLPLGEIAPMVGIANEYHLSRLLKSLLGVGVRDLR